MQHLNFAHRVLYIFKLFVSTQNEALIIDRGGNTAVVVISLEEYNSIKETEYLLSNPAVLEDIKNSLKEIEDGKGIELDLSEHPFSGIDKPESLKDPLRGLWSYQ